MNTGTTPAYRSAALARDLALERLERRPDHPLARRCYASALAALERVEAMEIAGQQNDRLGTNQTVATNEEKEFDRGSV